LQVRSHLGVEQFTTCGRSREDVVATQPCSAGISRISRCVRSMRADPAGSYNSGVGTVRMLDGRARIGAVTPSTW
jgi:hypothetical protein